MITIPSPQRITGIFIVYDFTLRSKTNVRHTQLKGSYNISIRERLIISYLVPHLDVGFVSPANLIRAASARRTPTRNSRHASGRTERVHWSSKSPFKLWITVKFHSKGRDTPFVPTKRLGDMNAII